MTLRRPVAPDTEEVLERIRETEGVLRPEQFGSLADPANGHVYLQTAFDAEATDKAIVTVQRKGLTVAMPTMVSDGLSLRLEGNITSTNTANAFQEPPIYWGDYAPPYTSPGWTAGLPDRPPVPLHAGAFNAAGEFELTDNPINNAWFAGLAVGQKLLFLHNGGYNFDIGNAGVGGVGRHPETVEFFLVKELRAGLPNVVVPDVRCDSEYKVGDICVARQESLKEQGGAGVGIFYNVAYDVTAEGPGGIVSQGQSNLRCGLARSKIDLALHVGRYGIGGNCLIDTIQNYQLVIATEKVADVAACSRRSSLGNGTGTIYCTGTGGALDPSTTCKAGENSRFINIHYKRVIWKNAVTGAAFNFVRCRDVTFMFDEVAYPGTGDVVSIGVDSTVVHYGGGVSRTNRCRALLGRVTAPNPRYFVIVATGGTLALDNEITGDFYGKPTTDAMFDTGTRTKARVFFENGSIRLAGAAADIEARLGNGTVTGITETSAEKVIINGERRWPGNVYPAPLTGPAATYAPNASIGRVGEARFAHHIVLGAGVTGFTLNSATGGRENDTLVVQIHNGSGGAVPLAKNVSSNYLGGGALANLDNGKKTILTFVKTGGSWVQTLATENVTLPGRVLLDETFDAPRYWKLPSGVLIRNGAIEFVSAPGGDAILPVAGLRPNALYQASWVVSGRTSGGARIRLGNQTTDANGFGQLAQNTTSAALLAGAVPETIILAFSSGTNGGYLLESLTVREL